MAMTTEVTEENVAFLEEMCKADPESYADKVGLHIVVNGPIGSFHAEFMTKDELDEMYPLGVVQRLETIYGDMDVYQ